MEETDRTPEPMAIYSKWAVLGFCVFFSPVFGGFMLRQNLRDKGLNGLGNGVLFLSFLMAAFTALLSSTAIRGPGTTFVANFLQGALLVEYVFGKHFVDAESMPKKSIMKPLRISLLIVLLLVALMQLTGVPLTPQ
jgi:hypothetical protein